MSDILKQVEQVVRDRVFSHNKYLSKSESYPVYADADQVAKAAMEHLIEALADLAMEDIEL